MHWSCHAHLVQIKIISRLQFSICTGKYIISVLKVSRRLIPNLDTNSVSKCTEIFIIFALKVPRVLVLQIFIPLLFLFSSCTANCIIFLLKHHYAHVFNPPQCWRMLCIYYQAIYTFWKLMGAAIPFSNPAHFFTVVYK